MRLSRSGWQVLAGVRTSADGARLSDEGAGRIEPVELDVTEPASIARLTERLGEGALAGLINNAGTAVSLPVELLPLDELRRQLEVNLVGHVAVMQAVLRNLRRVHGRIVNVGSIAGRSALPFLGAYAASKHALEAVTDALRIELHPFGIEVVIVEPGTIATPIWRKGAEAFERILPGLSPEVTALYRERMTAFRKQAAAAGRRGEPADEVAKAVERALTAQHPRTRYLVGRDARRRAIVERLPDRLRDRIYERALFRP